MSRELSASMLAAVEASNIRAALLLEMVFDSGTVRINSLAYNLDWDGETWLGGGDLARVSAAEEGEEIQAYGMTFTLSGVQPALLSIALNEDVQGRAVRMWLAAFDANYQIIADPYLVYRGRMDTMRVVAGAEATISLTCEGRLADFARARVRRYNNEDQQMVHDGDRFFEYVPSLVNRSLWWGTPTPAGVAQ